MKFGIALPHAELSIGSGELRDWAQGAEAIGFDHIRLPDHVLGANTESRPDWKGLYDVNVPFFEPLTTISFLAGHTSRIGFLSSILILPQRQTAVVAKQAAMADIFLGGRLRLGVGVGWNELEYEALGVDFKQRGDIYEEQIELLRALWCQKSVTFNLPHHTINDAGICPRPMQRPIPIWMGGGMDPSQAKPASEKVMRRIARLADGWMPVCQPDEQARAVFDKFFDYCRDYGRDPETIGIEVSIRGSAEMQDRWPDLIAAWKQMGASHIGFNTMGDGLRGAEQHLRRLEEIKVAIDGA